MVKKILNIIKRVILSCFVLYGYNLIISPLNIYIPINIITVSILTLLGIPAIFALIFINIIIF